ncbi:MAG: metallophosphoesterase [Thermoguttaceae bacterium]
MSPLWSFFWRFFPSIFLVGIGFYLWRRAVVATRYYAPQTSRRLVYTLAPGILLLIAAGLVAWNGVFVFVALLHLTVFLIFFGFLRRGFRRMGWDKKNAAFWDLVDRGGIGAVVLTAAVFAYGYVNMRHIVRTEYSVEAPVPLRAEGYKIVFLSDLHHGLATNASSLRRLADRLDAEDADLVILGGDIVDERTTLEEMREAFSILGGIKSRLGIYYVYGNHDRSPYSRSPNYAEQDVKNALSVSGIRALVDETQVVDDALTLVGREDAARNRQSLAELTRKTSASTARILVDHQPVEYEEAARDGYALILSGHTHAGQIFPFGLVTGITHHSSLNYGLRKLGGGTTAIVSSGVSGWGMPIRTSKHSEYVVVRLSGAGRLPEER